MPLLKATLFRSRPKSNLKRRWKRTSAPARTKPEEMTMHFLQGYLQFVIHVGLPMFILLCFTSWVAGLRWRARFAEGCLEEVRERAAFLKEELRGERRRRRYLE